MLHIFLMTNMYVSTILVEWFHIAKMSEKVHFYLPICLICAQNVSWKTGVDLDRKEK